MKELYFAPYNKGAMIRSADALNNLHKNKDLDFLPRNPKKPLLGKATSQDIHRKEEMMFLDDTFGVVCINISMVCISPIYNKLTSQATGIMEMNRTKREYQAGKYGIMASALLKSQAFHICCSVRTIMMGSTLIASL